MIRMAGNESTKLDDEEGYKDSGFCHFATVFLIRTWLQDQQKVFDLQETNLY